MAQYSVVEGLVGRRRRGAVSPQEAFDQFAALATQGRGEKGERPGIARRMKRRKLRGQLLHRVVPAQFLECAGAALNQTEEQHLHYAAFDGSLAELPGEKP